MSDSRTGAKREAAEKPAPKAAKAPEAPELEDGLTEDERRANREALLRAWPREAYETR